MPMPSTISLSKPSPPTQQHELHHGIEDGSQGYLGWPWHREMVLIILKLPSIKKVK